MSIENTATFSTEAHAMYKVVREENKQLKQQFEAAQKECELLKDGIAHDSRIHSNTRVQLLRTQEQLEAAQREKAEQAACCESALTARMIELNAERLNSEQVYKWVEQLQRERDQLAAMVELLRRDYVHHKSTCKWQFGCNCGLEQLLTPPAALAELLKPTIKALQTCLKNPMALRRMGAIKDSVIDELNRLEKLAGGGK